MGNGMAAKDGEKPDEGDSNTVKLELLSRTLKIKWERSGGDYTAAEIRSALNDAVGGKGSGAETDIVEDIVVQKSSKRRGSALVVVRSTSLAKVLTETLCGKPENLLRVRFGTTSPSPV